jgi:hypothetical protein
MRAGERIRRLPLWVKIVVPAVALAVAVVLAFVAFDAGDTTSVHARTRRVVPTTSATTTTSTTSTTTTATTTLPPPPETVPEPPPTNAPVTVPAAAAEPEPPAAPSVRVVTYSIETDGPVVSDVGELAGIAAQTYADPRGWSGAGIEFQRVDSSGSFTIVLANPNAVPGYSPGVCDTTYSCQSGRYVVINDARWSQGSPNWPGALSAYRQMVLNHETGHWLGLGHAFCSGPGELAPVMQQQSIDLLGCATNSWPLGWELDRVRR